MALFVQSNQGITVFRKGHYGSYTCFYLDKFKLLNALITNDNETTIILNRSINQKTTAVLLSTITFSKEKDLIKLVEGSSRVFTCNKRQIFITHIKDNDITRLYDENPTIIVAHEGR